VPWRKALFYERFECRQRARPEMTDKPLSNHDASRSSAPSQGLSAARFVLVAQALVIVAFAVGLSVEAGMPPLTAALAVAALVILVVAITKMVSRTKIAPAAAKVTRHDPGRDQAPAFGAHAASTGVKHAPEGDSAATLAQAPAAQVEQDDAWASGFDYSVLDARRRDAFLSPLDAAVAASPAVAPAPHVVTPPPLPRYPDPVPNRLPPRAPVQNNTAPAPQAHAASNRAPMGLAPDYWSFRPSQPRFEDKTLAPRATTPDVALPGVQVEVQDAALRETDVEAIQSLIKKLADEVNLADQQRHDFLAAAHDGQPGSNLTDSQIGDETLAPAHAQPHQPAVPAFEPERAVAQSVDALRVTAETMRQPSHLVFGHELPPPIPAPPSRASVLAAAISAGRADVLLEPILGLDSQEAQHFEVSIRLRADDGSVLALDVQDTEVRGTGLLPLFDAAKMTRTATVARRLAERGKTGSVFSSYSGESLTDLVFRSDAEAANKQRLPGSGQLVLTFSQGDARSFQAPEWASIAQMRALGFRFALSDVTDLDMDIEGLVGAGFDFVKLDADVFLTGLRSPDGLIPSGDVCRYLAGAGLALVVERIDDEDKFARVFGFGALLGQGQLFGGARVLKAEAAADAGRSAA
jgi:cyclic-di-GMP phosphodiesterase, flagellum assembly factor TipF